jgi:putative tricarboxylic transport membrane protein
VSEQQQPVENLDSGHRSRSRLGPFLVGAGMVVIGLVLLSQVFAIPAPGFGMRGPRFFPMLAVVLWLALSVAYLAQHTVGLLRDRGGLPAERFERTPALLTLVAVLVVYAFILDPVGYWISTSLFFVAAARTLGSRSLVRDAAIGVVLSLTVYLAFTRALGVRLPEGVLGF